MMTTKLELQHHDTSQGMLSHLAQLTREASVRELCESLGTDVLDIVFREPEVYPEVISAQ